jgi:hypothetical protein
MYRTRQGYNVIFMRLRNSIFSVFYADIIRINNISYGDIL